MKPRSMAVSAPQVLVMANGMQNGFILRWPCVSSASTAVANVSKPPKALPMSTPARCLFMAALPRDTAAPA